MPLVQVKPSLRFLSVYLLAVVVGRLAVLEGTGLALFWPAAGIAALWMLRGRTKYEVVLDATLLFTGATLAFLVLGKGLDTSLLFGAANLLQGLVVRALRARARRLPLTAALSPGLTSVRDLMQLITASVVAASLSAPLGMTGAWLLGEHVSGLTAIAWVVRNTCGTFVVAGVVLTLMAAPRERPHRVSITTERRPYAALELVAATLVTVFSGALVFSAPQQRPIAYVMIATSVWIGFRFSPAVGALHTIGFGTLAVLCTVAGWGPFGSIVDLGARAVAVQAFIAVSATIVLMLAFGAAERSALTVRLRESEARANGRADLVDAVTTVMTDGLVVVDANGAVLLSNPAAETLAGIGAGTRQVGTAQQHGFVRTDGGVPAAEDLPRARALRGEFVPPTDLLRIDPHTGQQTVLSITAMPLNKPDPDAPAVAVLVLRDVTKARAQSRELESFAGVVAHDLKTPLTGVVSWAEILEEQLDEAGIDEEHTLRASVQRIRGSADRMAALISDLLDFNQTQNAELTLEPVSLDEMVDQIARDLRDTHHQEIPLVEHAPLGHVMADRTLARQLFTNVIGNAVKYVAPGVIPHIVIGSAPIDDMLQIWVSDNGIGIRDKDLGRVFDTFFRAPSSTQDYPGTGLGLAICARMVERHGGRISARKGLGGEGTTMLFTLPLHQPVPLVSDDELDVEALSATS